MSNGQVDENGSFFDARQWMLEIGCLMLDERE